ncbi:hypothetical protein F544_7300 [Bibersteinia trehalosi USDA-ARS-USMARC-190]|uniref:Uncharacterized protein n=1 Tax=Bibersteinia trehalosi USDA-ARS-USMARC-190 TaxID=1263832 RepID=W0R670_BIBTR|nr:hypothetical protein F544_7300 [Bibersteinia trehalosi USDA-ARS-USMARC-190]
MVYHTFFYIQQNWQIIAEIAKQAVKIRKNFAKSRKETSRTPNFG